LCQEDVVLKEGVAAKRDYEVIPAFLLQAIRRWHSFDAAYVITRQAVPIEDLAS
jgi:hypothetical protein